MMTTRYLAIATAWVTGLAGVAAAQQVPPPEGGDPVVTATLVGNQVEMRDAASNAPIILPKGVALWDDKNNAGSLEPVISFQAQPSGFDVTYTFTNSSQQPRTLGALNVGILTLGRRVDYPELRSICEPRYADYEESYKVRQMHYPDTLYSPAWVFQNKDYAVGISIQYPILEYKHSVRFCLYSPEGKFAQGEGGRGWRLECLLSNVGNETEENKLAFPGSIDAGETRTYVVSVRVTRKPAEWVRTLVPYRNWFRGAYGGVDYKRQGKCISERTFSSGPLCADDNPFGFVESRPDVDGWDPTIGNLLRRRTWDTLLFLRPSGSYRSNPNGNTPYQFATHLNATKPLATAFDPEIGFPRFRAAGQKIALWWGHSVQVADEWDDATLVPFDPTNQDHRRLAFAEMDLAVKAGATTIGLDAFNPKVVPVWDLVNWLHDLKARYPGVRFCAEPIATDLIHREVATFYRGSKDRSEVSSADEIDGFSNPHFMADFLLPGHEIWGAFRWSAYADFGITFTDQQKTEKLRRIAALGYTPCAQDPFDLLDPSIEAAESWKVTVPADLQLVEEKGSSPDDPFPTFETFDAAFKAGDMRTDLVADDRLTIADYRAWQSLHPPQTSPGDEEQAASERKKLDKARPGKSASSRQSAKAPTTRAGARSPARRGGKPDRTPRMEMKVTGPIPSEGAPPGAPRKGFFINASPITFTESEIAAAIARARGFNEEAIESAEMEEDTK